MKKILKQKNNGFTPTPKSLVSGFTLVETLVAISIFSMSLLGLMSVLASGITNTTYAKQKMVASYLAQEGIEYIRNMRDTFVIYDATSGATGWTSFNTKLDTASCLTSKTPPNGCYFDDRFLNYTNTPSQPILGASILGACNGACPSLYYDATTGKYSYGGSINSGFIRKISATPISADETRIISSVSWKQGSGTYNIIFSEELFNWVE